MQFFFFYNDTTQWLSLIWLNKRHVITPPNIGALCETQALTWNFPSSAVAEFKPVPPSYFTHLASPCFSFTTILHRLFKIFIYLLIYYNFSTFATTLKSPSTFPNLLQSRAKPVLARWITHSVLWQPICPVLVFWSEINIYSTFTAHRFSERMRCLLFSLRLRL